MDGMEAMILEQVLYEVFESDAAWLDDNWESGVHEIDREIRMVFQGAHPDIYVSWDQTGDLVHIAMRNATFFTPPAPTVRDASTSAIWTDLVGQDVTFEFLREDKQVLCVMAGEHAVYCCSYEDGYWEADVVHIASQKPA